MKPSMEQTSRDLTTDTPKGKDNQQLPCRGCQKTFKTEAARILHERVHTGEKPFACRECGKQFASSSIRLAHKRKHHKGWKTSQL